MSAEAAELPQRFPGFRALDQAEHWDAATRRLVLRRLEPPTEPRFFQPHEAATAAALVTQLVGVDADLAPTLAGSIDARLADGQTDGWHYDDMPRDAEAWRRGLAGLDEDSAGRTGSAFADASFEDQHAMLADLRVGPSERWHGLRRRHIWDLWMRYSCTAYYALPAAWDEVGSPGPAYPRGYKNLGIGAREPFEVADSGAQGRPTPGGDG